MYFSGEYILSSFQERTVLPIHMVLTSIIMTLLLSALTVLTVGMQAYSKNTSHTLKED